ncbi:uncharacterized protein V2V93DRAFT_366754 [Kockiozyma suomiensis]|uniref:uncharacterized protein n=1 Tax=Kockiozyma suomiensis TaxID=1337062 RepID=UPI003343CFA3
MTDILPSEECLELITLLTVSDHVFSLYSERRVPDNQNLGYVSRTSGILPVEIKVSSLFFWDVLRKNSGCEQSVLQNIETGIKPMKRTRKTKPSHAKDLDEDCISLEFSLHQSLELLHSSKENSTTGAILWRVSPFFAEWVLTPGTVFYPLFTRLRHETEQLRIIEIGAGVGGVLTCALSLPFFASTSDSKCSGGLYVATDQLHILPFLRKNIAYNMHVSQEAIAQALPDHRRAEKAPSYTSLTIAKQETKESPHPIDRRTKQKSKSPSIGSRKNSDREVAAATAQIEVLELDWERAKQDIKYVKDTLSVQDFDIVIACDTIYNDFLITPFVNTLSLLASDRTHILVGVQMRAHDVLEAFLKEVFKVGGLQVWYVKAEYLSRNLRDGFAIYYLRKSSD